MPLGDLFPFYFGDGRGKGGRRDGLGLLVYDSLSFFRIKVEMMTHNEMNNVANIIMQLKFLVLDSLSDS